MKQVLQISFIKLYEAIYIEDRPHKEKYYEGNWKNV